VPFEIPESWDWTRIFTVSYTIGTKFNQIKSTEIKTAGNYKVVSQGANLFDGFTNESEKVIDDLPLIMFGDHTRNVKYIDFPFVIGAYGTKFHKALGIESLYLYYWMKWATNSMYNRGYARHYTLLKKVYIPLPPLAEQQRIINQIDFTLKKVSDYAKAYESLEKLNKQFPDKLRKSILQYAMQGKLVPQDPTDEPVEVLLEKIRAEKLKLYEAGKLKKNDLQETVIYKAEDNSYYWNKEKIDFDTPIPTSWKLIYFKDILKLVSGRDLKTSDFQDDLEGAIPYLTGASNFTDGKIITSRSTNFPSVIAYKNDLLITVKGTVGEIAYNPFNQAHIARQIMAISSFYDMDLEFIRYFLSSKIDAIQFHAQSMIPGISREVLLSLLIPFPPENEQNRIVHTIYKLTQKLNRLKAVK